MPFIVKKTVPETFLERVKASPERPAFQFKPTYPEAGTPNVWREITFREFYDEVRHIAFGLFKLGLMPTDRVALVSATRFEWSAIDMAVMSCRAATVPIYPSNLPDDVAYIVNHSESRFAFLENGVQLQKVLQKLNENPKAFPHLSRLIVIEPGAMELVRSQGSLPIEIMTLHSLKEMGRAEEASAPHRFEETIASVRPDDLFTICYTSGTTGTPKGVMLTHDSMVSVLEDASAFLSGATEPETEIVLSFLPFSHILGRVESVCVYTFGWKNAFAENLDKIMDNMTEVKPTVIFCVPRIFEKAYNKIQGQVEDGPVTKRHLFRRAFSVGRSYYQAIWENRIPGFREIAGYQLAKKVVFKKILDRFGGNLRFAVCGGAPLPKEIGEFFQIVGIKILEGYGLTETCAPVTLNSPNNPRFGVVGRPLPEVQIRIGEDEEILIKSRKVFTGYYKNPAATAEALEAGWLHTGDIGHIDRDGTLHITDRKKDIIITSAGKNVAPQKIENLAKSIPMFNQLVVIGDRRHYLTALITLNKDLIIQFANDNNILFSEYSELIRHPKVMSKIQSLVDELNRQLASFETIKKFVVLPQEFTIEAGEITPSLKIRRKIIQDRYYAEIESMYA